MHPADRPLYDRVVEQGRKYGLQIEAPPPPDVDLADGDAVTVGGLRFDVMHVPGHAPGHVAFVGHGVVFGGDCLFAGSIGRTDLPLSDPRALEQSLQRFAALPPDTVVYPGHGPATTIGEENRTNPFLTGAARVLKR
jgi:glyoxylase-like metal-dependent hydrolase (beta-lactamase superfamily II)